MSSVHHLALDTRPSRLGSSLRAAADQLARPWQRGKQAGVRMRDPDMHASEHQLGTASGVTFEEAGHRIDDRLGSSRLDENRPSPPFRR